VILVIDASVAVKWFHNESGSREAMALLARGDHLVAPDLLAAEVCNVTWKMLRRGMMTEEQQVAAMVRLPSILDELVPNTPLAPRAASISARLDYPAYDCFYLALVEQRGGLLVSADRRLLRRTAGTMWEAMVTDLALLSPR
jgi:predicted nucleic acid-binding protein